MKPLSAGWEQLSPLERLAYWFEGRKPAFRGHIREYRTLMENFCISCKDPGLGDYVNFTRDVRFYEAAHQELLCKGFFAMYNTSPALLVKRAKRESDPRRN